MVILTFTLRWVNKKAVNNPKIETSPLAIFRVTREPIEAPIESQRHTFKNSLTTTVSKLPDQISDY